jgi:GLPGLI family protein
MKYLLLSGFLLFNFLTFSQESLIIFRHIENPQNFPQGKKELPARLYFNSNNWYYNIEKKPVENSTEEIGDSRVKMNRGSGTPKVEFCLTSLDDKTQYSMERVLARMVLVKDNFEKPNWVIQKDKKKIDRFNCQKATTFFRSRSYTAWFCEDLPSSAGPWKLWGLPGLILEAISDDGEVSFLFDEYHSNKKTERPELDLLKAQDESKFIDIRKKTQTNFIKSMETKGAIANPNNFSIDKYPN